MPSNLLIYENRRNLVKVTTDGNLLMEPTDVAEALNSQIPSRSQENLLVTSRIKTVTQFLQCQILTSLFQASRSYTTILALQWNLPQILFQQGFLNWRLRRLHPYFVSYSNSHTTPVKFHLTGRKPTSQLSSKRRQDQSGKLKTSLTYLHCP